MKRLTCALATAAVMFAAPAFAQQYDLVINGGRVMDPETMFDSIANVGIKDGRIRAITKQAITGKETIDAKGLVVAPGFIDTHFHSVDVFATKMALRDGVTTGMDLEQGAARVGQWYAQKEKEGWQCNFGTTSSLMFNRLIVHDPEVKFDGPADMATGGPLVNASAKDGVPGWSVTRSDLDHMNQVVRLLDEDLRQGAIGIGVGSAYMARGLTTYEQFEAQRAAARYGRLTSVHTRFHLSNQTPTEAQIGLDEVLVNAMLLKAPLILAHDNDYGWRENEEKLRKAHDQGHTVWGEYYPYIEGSTGVSADFLQPKLWMEKYHYEYKNTLYDPTTDSYIPDRAAYEKIVKEEPGRIVVVVMPYRNMGRQVAAHSAHDRGHGFDDRRRQRWQVPALERGLQQVRRQSAYAGRHGQGAAPRARTGRAADVHVGATQLLVRAASWRHRTSGHEGSRPGASRQDRGPHADRCGKSHRQFDHEEGRARSAFHGSALCDRQRNDCREEQHGVAREARQTDPVPG